jgi:hypothetical protein
MSETQTVEQIDLTIENQPEFKAPMVAPSAYVPAVADEAAPLRMVLGTYLTSDKVTAEKVQFILEEIKAAHKRHDERLFQAAFARAQGNFGRAAKNRKIAYEAKGDKPGRNTPYADWHSHWETAGPHLNAEGLSVWHDLIMKPGDQITVIAKLQGFGITREVSVTLPHDPSGQKNAVQAMGSSQMYGRRYTGCAILNLTVKDDELDDDAGGGDPETITDEQCAELLKLLEENEIPLNAFCKALEIENLSKLLIGDYGRAMSRIAVTIRRRAESNVKF